MNQKHIGGRGRQGDGSKILERIVGNFRVETGIDDVARADNHDGVAVGSGSCSGTHAKISTSARLVLHIEVLAETACEISRDDPRKDIRRAPGRKGHDHANRPSRISLRLRNSGNKRHGRGACSQKKKSPSSKIHKYSVGWVQSSGF